MHRLKSEKDHFLEAWTTARKGQDFYNFFEFFGIFSRDRGYPLHFLLKYFSFAVFAAFFIFLKHFAMVKHFLHYCPHGTLSHIIPYPPQGGTYATASHLTVLLLVVLVVWFASCWTHTIGLGQNAQDDERSTRRWTPKKLRLQRVWLCWYFLLTASMAWLVKPASALL